MKKNRINNKEEKLGKQFFRYVSMNVLGMVGISCYILADTFFVSNGVGIDGLTALNLVIPVFNFIFAVALMLGMGGATRFSILRGEGKEENAKPIFTQVIMAAAVFSVILILTGILFTDNIVRLLGANDSIHELTKTYLKTILIFTPMFCLNHILTCFIRNDGKPGLAMAAMTVGSLANILFDYILIYPLGLGMFGAALATGTSPLFSILICCSHFVKKENTFQLLKTKSSIKRVWDICKLGVSSFVNELSSGVVILLLNTIILSLKGNVGVAAYGVVANVALVLSSVFTGVGQGIQPLISVYFGQNEEEKIKKIFRMAVVTSLCISIVSYLLIWFGNSTIVQVFNSEGNSNMAAIAENGLKLYFIGFFLCGFNIVTTFYFSASSKPGSAFLISILRGFICIILMSVLLSYLFEMNGVWLGFPAAELVTAVIGMVVLLKFQHRKAGK